MSLSGLSGIAWGLTAVAVVAVGVRIALLRPSNEGLFVESQRVMASVERDGDAVRVSGVRNFRYRSTTDFDVVFEERTYDLSRIESVWYVVTPFSREWRGAAHTFLSFGFSDSTFVAVSVEARREPGESYSMLQGLFRRYQLIYVIGDERDLIGLRAIHAGDDVVLYPIRAEPASVRALFLDILERAERLRTEPEFYNTLLNNCTTTIVDHVNRVVSPPIRFGPRILLPGYSDRIAYRRGLIDTELTLPEARERFRVNDRAHRYQDDPRFSLRIREAAP